MQGDRAFGGSSKQSTRPQRLSSRSHQEVGECFKRAQAALGRRIDLVQDGAQNLEDTVAAQVSGQALQAQRMVEARFEGMFQAQTQRIEELLAPKRSRNNEAQ